MDTAGVIRGILIRLLQSFGVPGVSPVWYRRYFPLILLLVVAVGGVFIWTAGTAALVAIVDSWTAPPVPPPASSKPVEGGVHAALVVAWLAFVLLVVMLINLGLLSARREPLSFVLPATLYSWLAGAASLGVGLLIGTTVFR